MTARTLSAGADLAFVKDSSALVIVEKTGETFRPISIDEMRPTQSRDLKPSEVYKRFAARLHEFDLRDVVVDIHEQSNTREQLQLLGIGILPAPGGESGKVKMYTLMRTLLQEGRLELPQLPRLINQLKSLVMRPTSGGGMRIEAPRRGRGSGHGDIVSALVCALVHHAHFTPHKYKGAELENLRRGGRYQTPAGSDAFFGDAYPRAGSCREDGPTGYHGMAGRDLNAAIIPHIQFQ
jgi:hypothetical protein